MTATGEAALSRNDSDASPDQRDAAVV